ncbi:hypothetical protein [Catellatospora sp. NPDC049609]|uniref:hypothetical protein n=1 Tax=Catellatospora sp. NPDC049609 TaxID=3155505 RepID=UPI00344A696D
MSTMTDTLRPYGLSHAAVSDVRDPLADLELCYDAFQQVALIESDGGWNRSTEADLATMCTMSFTGWRGGVPMDGDDF